MVEQQEHKDSERKIALCYVRQSYTRDDEDTNSPERQRANIQRIVERHSWTPEWYEDVGGHKSGRSEKNRPGWLALKDRLGDGDVAAVIANDLSRLHRNVSSVSSLLEILEHHKIALVLAATDITIDTSTLMGQMFAQFGSLMDAYYAKDISVKAKDSIAHRKRQGKVVGIPPFGTTRNDNGYLIPSDEGAWLLPDGDYMAGVVDQFPDDGAVWRSYYKCAVYVLEIYAEGNIGLEKIAYRMNQEGWPFRDRWGNPRSMTRDDIRRVVSNWPEYGGIVVGKRGKDRPAYEAYDPEVIPFVEDRAVMSVDLLRKVANVKQKRTVRPKDKGKGRKAYSYSLSVITRCVHCERLAIEKNNPKLQSTLHGKLDARGVRRYVHRRGVTCGCQNRSVPCEVIEADFKRFLDLMTIDPELVDMLTEFAIQADKVRGVHQPEDLEKKKHEAIALAQRKINAAVVLFDEGRIDYAAYRKRIDKNERDIAYWNSRTTEAEKLAFELATCIEAVSEIVQTWDTAEPETRQKLVRNLFEYIIYDLDTRRIVDFKLSAWARPYVTLRMGLYEDVFEVLEKEISTSIQEGGNDVPPTGAISNIYLLPLTA